jgi:hypothetical protein
MTGGRRGVIVLLLLALLQGTTMGAHIDTLATATALTFATFTAHASGVQMGDAESMETMLSKAHQELSQLDDEGIAQVLRVIEDLKTNGTKEGHGCSDVLVECPYSIRHGQKIAPVRLIRTAPDKWDSVSKLGKWFGARKNQAGHLNDAYAVMKEAGAMAKGSVALGEKLGDNLPGYNLASSALLWVAHEMYARSTGCPTITFDFCPPRPDEKGPPPMKMDLATMWYMEALADNLLEKEKFPRSPDYVNKKNEREQIGRRHEG